MIDRRAINLGLLSTAVTGLVGCSSTGQSLSSNGPDVMTLAGAENVTLNPDGSAQLADLMQEGPLGDKWLGRKDAPVTMIKYASLTCPYCRKFHLETFPTLKREYINKGKIRFILREFPIGHASGTATLVMRSAGQKDDKAYFALYDKFITNQKRWISQKVRHDAIFKVASETGLTRAQYDAAIKDEKSITGLKWVKQRGRRLGIIGTPTFFINGKKHRSVLTMKEIQGMTAPYLA